MGEPTYDDVRRARADRPAGGNFLSARDYAENTTIDVNVTGTELRAPYVAPGKTADPTTLPDIYWQADVEGKTGQTTLVKENSFVSDWLEEHGVDNPVGHQFRLVVTSYKGNRSFKVSKQLA